MPETLVCSKKQMQAILSPKKSFTSEKPKNLIYLHVIRRNFNYVSIFIVSVNNPFCQKFHWYNIIIIEQTVLDLDL